MAFPQALGAATHPFQRLWVGVWVLLRVLPHRIEAELIPALGKGTNLDVAAADQSRPSATRTARPIHPMRCISSPILAR
jgi:hypothetical protein